MTTTFSTIDASELASVPGGRANGARARTTATKRDPCDAYFDRAAAELREADRLEPRSDAVPGPHALRGVVLAMTGGSCEMSRRGP